MGGDKFWMLLLQLTAVKMMMVVMVITHDEETEVVNGICFFNEYDADKV